MYVPPILGLRQGRQAEVGPFRGITVTVITGMLASVSVYLRTWASYDRLSDSVGNTAYSIFSTEKDHFDFIIGSPFILNTCINIMINSYWLKIGYNVTPCCFSSRWRHCREPCTFSFLNLFYFYFEASIVSTMLIILGCV